MTDPAEITARLNAATPGPWKALVLRDMNDAALVRPILDDYSDGGEGLLGIADAEFVANAPTDIAFLLSRVAVLEAQKQAALADAWDDGYSRAESDHWGTGFWAIGMRENPFRALGGEETT